MIEIRSDDKLELAVVVIIVASLVVGAFFLTQKKPEAKSVTSIDKIEVVDTQDVGWHAMEDGYYKEEVEGYWLVSLVVNEPDRFSFLVNEGEGLRTDEVDGVSGPSGSKVVAKSSVSVEFEKGIPYYVSSLKQEAFKIQDANIIVHTDRYFPYLTMGEGDWKYFLAPYDVTYKKNGSTIDQRIIVYGPGSGDFDWTTGQTYKIKDLTFTNLGTLRGYSTGPPSRRYALIRDKDGSGEKVYLLSDLKDHFGNYGMPAFAWSSCNTYSEFWKNILHEKIYGGDSDPISEAPKAQRIKSVANLNEELNNYPEEVDSWYSGILPDADTYESKHPSAIGTDTYVPGTGDTVDGSITSFTLGHKYGLLKAGPVSGFPRVNVEAPASKFDAVVWYPPSGDVEILDVSDITVDEEGGRGTISVRYKNIGKTPATFHVSCDAPEIGSVLSLPPNATLKPNETTTQTISLGGVTVEEDRTMEGEVTVTATRTNNSDTGTFTMTVRNLENGPPGPGPEETGDITGLVVDKDTERPIGGASAYTGTGQAATTGVSGKFTIEEVPAGQAVTVNVTASGYQKESREVNVIAGETVTVGTVYMEEQKGLPWLWIAIAGVIIASVIIIVYIYREDISRALGG